MRNLIKKIRKSNYYEFKLFQSLPLAKLRRKRSLASSGSEARKALGVLIPCSFISSIDGNSWRFRLRMAPLVEDVAAEGGRLPLHPGNLRFAIPLVANIVVCASCLVSRNGRKNGKASGFEKEYL